MTTEEKAKAYDKVREKIAIRFGSNVADEIFSQFEMSEDERLRKALIDGFKRFDCSIWNGISIKHILAWLEKQGQQDMIPLDKVIKFLDEQLVNDKDEVTGEPFINFQNYGAFKETFISFFKRKMFEKQGEQKPAWSEEDEKMFKSLKTLLNNASCYLCTESTDKIISWLKSLRPQNRWKPTKEQIIALEFVVKAFNESFLTASYGDTKRQVTELLNKLKAL